MWEWKLQWRGRAIREVSFKLKGLSPVSSRLLQLWTLLSKKATEQSPVVAEDITDCQKRQQIFSSRLSEGHQPWLFPSWQARRAVEEIGRWKQWKRGEWWCHFWVPILILSDLLSRVIPSTSRTLSLVIPAVSCIWINTFNWSMQLLKAFFENSQYHFSYLNTKINEVIQ